MQSWVFTGLFSNWFHIVRLHKPKMDRIWVLSSGVCLFAVSDNP